MNENEQNGLFSEDYETPKRENPYLKKNREKAKTEKPKRERKSRETESPCVPVADEPTTAETPPADPHTYDTPPAYDDPDREVGYTHKRTFSDWMFEHVKLIATIATIIVVLSLVLITDVVSIVENLITQTQQADKEDLSLKYVEGLSEMSQPITWENLEKFKRDETKATDSVTWMIPVEGTGYELWVSGVSTKKPPTYVYLYDMRTGDRLVLGEEDFDAFIESHPTK